MTRQEVKSMVSNMHITFDPVHPDHIEAKRLVRLRPPFLEYTLEDVPVYADGVRYCDIMRLRIRLYSDVEVSGVETIIHEVLEGNDLRWQRDSEYIEELALWAIIYTVEV